MPFVPGIATPATRGRQFIVIGQALALAEDDSLPHGAAPPDALFLGELAGEPCFATLAEAPPDGCVAVELRSLHGVLPITEYEVALRALGLTAWDRDHRFCGRCGAPTERSAVERVRTCTRCKLGVYPRISPAVIVRVEREGKILLARNARSPRRFHSVLAGFVEVGESLEDTVHREIREEVGIAVTDLRYFGSQAWPYTSSLMLAFTARWAGGELAPDPSEIAEADWYAPDALPVVPPPLSIARSLIDDFVASSTP